MTSIDRESDDIFARDEYTDDEEESRGDDVDEEEEDGDDASCELTAAVALTTLVSRSESSNSREQRREETSKPRSGDKEQEMELQIPQRFTKSGRKRAVSFPLKLLKVLSTTKHSDVIAWTPSGTAFEIRKPKQFVVDILPKYFKSAKYSSFTRKLHRWNFQRHYRGDEAGAFYHPEFIKDRMDLVEQMTCKLDGPSPDTKAKAKTSKPASSGAKKNKPKAKVGATHPPSAQSRPLVTLNASQVVHNYGGPVMHHRPVVQPQPSSSGLSAAIEMEVARRLEERISAATFSRQALAMLEQQQQQQQQVQATLNAMIERRFQALISHQNNLAAANASARSLTSGNLGHHHPLVQGLGPAATRPPMDFAAPAVARPADLAQLYQKFKPAASYNYAFGDDTPALPPTNIQGARTA